MLTQERLKEIVDYDPLTGVFTSKLSRGRIKAGQLLGSPDCHAGYLLIAVDKRRYKAHRLAFLYVHGYIPNGDVDHKNKIRTDNRIINLRDANRSQNCGNATRKNTNKLGAKGIHKRRCKYIAQIQKDGIKYFCGQYITIEEAKLAYLNKAKELFGEFASAGN